MDTRVFFFAFLGLHVALAFALDAADFGVVADALVLQAALLLCLGLILTATLFLRIAQKRRPSPHKTLARIIARDRQRLTEGTLFLIAWALMMQIYMMLKVAIPTIVPFYADPALAEWDAWLFGDDPWRITHALLGDTATRLLDFFYVTPSLVIQLCMILWVCFSHDRVFSRRGIIAVVMCWFLIGVWTATALSSVGPVYMEHFYGDPRFADLTATLPPDLTATRTQAYLLDGFGEPGFGKGISAAPSMHNTLFLLLILMIYNRFGNDWRLWLAIAFEAITFVSSIHLGWHYAMDGIIAALLVGPIWYAAAHIDKLPSVILRMPRARAVSGQPA